MGKAAATTTTSCGLDLARPLGVVNLSPFEPHKARRRPPFFPRIRDIARRKLCEQKTELSFLKPQDVVVREGPTTMGWGDVFLGNFLLLNAFENQRADARRLIGNLNGGKHLIAARLGDLFTSKQPCQRLPRFNLVAESDLHLKAS
jgi:hypothetical protein